MARCALGRLLLGSVATNNDYFDAAVVMARSAHENARIPCVLLAISDDVSIQGSHLYSDKLHFVVPTLLPHVSSWRPDMSWCRKRLSGWRHTSVLKCALLYSILSGGHDAFIVDADWRFISNPFDKLLTCTTVSILGARDDHFLNAGRLFIRSTSATLELSRRLANRTLVAWDQAILNEELSALDSHTQCCAANRFLDAHLVRSERIHSMKTQAAPHCRVDLRQLPPGRVLPPPDQLVNAGDPLMWAQPWNSMRHNELKSQYHHRCPTCYNRCTLHRCFETADAGCRMLAASTVHGVRIDHQSVGLHAGPGARSSTAASGFNCSWASGCCRRHPRACPSSHASTARARQQPPRTKRRTTSYASQVQKVRVPKLPKSSKDVPIWRIMSPLTTDQ
uniref:Nucleotide-diphospho-sugar transferase domain-containing protein n=1 Tax=Coccolithus braarudii TaxID=221442 RepID=A0A7S0Q2I6_9EUKA|mmetsp:Transcript_30137/g.64767  ORF Transcript_30137/g.64767 Transcript_30137/m.64767 type:complete len:393 (+) Transcript_30137:164-1342(+)